MDCLSYSLKLCLTFQFYNPTNSLHFKPFPRFFQYQSTTFSALCNVDYEYHLNSEGPGTFKEKNSSLLSFLHIGYCCKSRSLADKQKKVVSSSHGGWGVPRSSAGATSGESCFLVHCLLLLPVLAAREPIPSWPDPSQSACLLGSSPRAG